MTKTLLSTRELAARWGLSQHTLRQWVSQRRIPFYKLGRLVKFDIRYLEDEWLPEHKVQPIEI